MDVLEKCPAAGVPSKRRRARMITEARRQQNRAAQKAYRERNKERREYLQRRQKGFSGGRRELRPNVLFVADENGSWSYPAAAPESQRAQLPQSTAGPELELNSQQNHCLQPSFIAGGVSDPVPIALSSLLRDDVELSMQPEPSLTQFNSMGPSPVLNGTALIDPALQQRREFSWASSIPFFLPWQFPAPPPQIGASRTTSGTKDRLSGLIDVLEDRGLRIEEVISIGLESLSRRWFQRRPLETPTLFSPPDPYLNSIQFSRTTTFLGLLCNARCIGISLQDLLTPQHPSPFYDPAKANAPPQVLLATATKPSIPVDLRPTLPQVIFPHPAYLDLLPFPGLRARAITLAATMPHVFNPLDLKWDFLEDGLICWRSRTCGGGEPGQPWDMRSWEAAPWFLQKWSMLIKGGNGEI
ncbi:uncharacterized protein Z518_06786 [Rhinocladiella mackenziei CBS 650.93]|uniref:Rhinocladiella mackenziei CBS 650.93 unplaced genomic scaffold supercont1.5, whole genome shotgun sequence n=1 Tax=Rhinocladiella mackenziei CBS 650.93 TaxID=1442369 RepID=A0A0D2IBP1_9EURO|nr:uncharacterized protein Z518_06786 [Rhinocladiella mackenziei CBS 650.93]KIX03234.1 hypothetical protein Z518_06786 [Rhinocladiella mackenziei CBS 650.93]